MDASNMRTFFLTGTLDIRATGMKIEIEVRIIYKRARGYSLCNSSNIFVKYVTF